MIQSGTLDVHSRSNNFKMKIIHKDKWGFWPLQWYTFIVEDNDGGLTELDIEKDIWVQYNVGDYFDNQHYNQFYKHDK
jgi:hypothetical protein